MWENAVWKDVCASYRTGLLRIQKLMSTNATRPASERRLLIKKQTRILAEYTSQLQYLFSLKLKSRRKLAALLRQRNVMLDSYKEQTPGRFDTEKERRVFRRILAQLIARIRRRFRRNLSKQQQQGSFDAQGQKLMNQFTKSINGLRKSLFVKIRTIRKINKAIPSVI